MDDFDNLIESLNELNSFNGKTFKINEAIRTAGKEVDLPLKKRIRNTDKAALDRDAMEKAIAGNVDETRIDGLIDEYVKEKILRGFM